MNVFFLGNLQYYERLFGWFEVPKPGIIVHKYIVSICIHYIYHMIAFRLSYTYPRRSQFCSVLEQHNLHRLDLLPRQISPCGWRLRRDAPASSCLAAPRGAAHETFSGGGSLGRLFFGGKTLGKNFRWFLVMDIEVEVIEHFMFEREAYFESK